MAGERLNPEIISPKIEAFVYTAPTACISAFDSYYRGPDIHRVWESEDKLAQAIATVTYLPPDLEGMKPVYTHLAQRLSEGPLQSRLLALSMSNIMLHQMSLPYGERIIHENATLAEKEQYQKISASLFKKFPKSEEAMRERQKLSEAAAFFRVELNETVGTEHKSVDQLTLQIEMVNMLVDEGPIIEFEAAAGNPDWNIAFQQIQERGIAAVASNPLTTELLLAGDLEATDDEIQGEAFLSALDREIDTSSEGRHASELAAYFFRYRPIQPYFWDTVLEEPTQYREHAFLFFRQPNDREQLFLASAFHDRVGWEELDKKQRTARVRKVVGLVSEFKAQYPDEKEIHTSLSTNMITLAQERGVQDTVEPIIGILEDEQPGIVFIDSQGEAHVTAPQNGEDLDSLAARVQDVGQTAVYQSTAEVPVRISGKTEVQEVADKKYLSLEGEDFATVFRWPHAQKIRPEDIEKVNTHVSNQLHMDEGEEEDLFEYVTNLQDSSKTQSGDFSAVFPQLLPQGHRLRILDKVGIVSVESSDSIVSAVIDPESALIKTKNPGLVVLQGRIDDGGNFVPLDTPPDVLDLPLQLTLTGAAQFAMRYPTSNRELTVDELSNVRETIIGYNRGQKYQPELPIIVVPKTATTHQDNTLNQSVLVPTGKKGEFIPALLDFKQSPAINTATETRTEVIVASASEQGPLSLQQIDEFVESLDPDMKVRAYVLKQYFLENLFARSEQRLGARLEREVLDDTMHEVFKLQVNGTSFLVLLQDALTEAFKKGECEPPAPAGIRVEREGRSFADPEIILKDADLVPLKKEHKTPQAVVVLPDTSIDASEIPVKQSGTIVSMPISESSDQSKPEATAGAKNAATADKETSLPKARRRQPTQLIPGKAVSPVRSALVQTGEPALPKAIQQKREIDPARRAAVTQALGELKSLIAQGYNPDYLALCNSGHEELAEKIQRLIGFGSALTGMLTVDGGKKAAETRPSHPADLDPRVQRIIASPDKFRELGNCRESDPEDLFVQGAAQHRAKLICRGCDVRGLCLAEAVDTGSEFGVWGGMTDRERRAMVRRVADTDALVAKLRKENIAYLRGENLNS